jgi:hypothetical protein
MRRWPAAAALVVPLLAGCDLLVAPTPTATPMPTALPTRAATPTPEPTPAPTATGEPSTPSPTPEPALSLDLPSERDDRRVRVAVASELPVDANGRIMVTVTNLSDSIIDEIVLRWPTALGDVLFLAPFQPTEERIRDGGPPLVQDWTKWVEGPGERGEPAGTTSLGYGPMNPGMELAIPLFATRAADGEVAFDLQLLAGERLLTLEDGQPAELRVEAP